MDIIRKHLVSNRLVNISDVLKESVLFEMDIEDINNDAVVGGEQLNENNSLFVFQNNEPNHPDERYCYIKVLNHIGGDGETKAIEVEKIITDSELLYVSLFETIFKILFQQESGTLTNRIIIGKYNERYPLNLKETATKIAEYLFNCYTEFTTDEYPEHKITNSF